MIKKPEPSRKRRERNAEDADLQAAEAATLNVDHKADAPIDDAVDVETPNRETTDQ